MSPPLESGESCNFHEEVIQSALQLVLGCLGTVPVRMLSLGNQLPCCEEPVPFAEVVCGSFCQHSQLRPAFGPSWLDATCLSGEVSWKRIIWFHCSSSHPLESSPSIWFLLTEAPWIIEQRQAIPAVPCPKNSWPTDSMSITKGYATEFQSSLL